MSFVTSGTWLANVSGHRLTKVAFAVVSFALCGWGLASQWGQVVDGVGQIGLRRTLASIPLMALGLVLGMASWRVLLQAMGSRLPVGQGASMYFLGQIGKYVPGSLWPVAAQMELGRHQRIPRARSATSILLALCISLATGTAAVICALPVLDPETAHRSMWLLLALPVLLSVLYPPLLWRLLRHVPRLGPSLALGPIPRVSDVALAVLLSALGWLAYGAHVWILLTSFGPEYRGWRALAISVGGYAFAWVAGLLVFILPAGAGARDLSLVVALSAVLPAHQGLALAILSRAVSIACDLVVAAMSAVYVGRLRRGWAAVPTRQEPMQELMQDSPL